MGSDCNNKNIKPMKKLLFIFLTSVIFFGGQAAAAAPSVITDLSCVSGTGGTIFLSWSAPTGAVNYDLRYSTSTITKYNFNSFLSYQSEIDSTNNLAVNNLEMNKSWFFAIRSSNSAGEISEISNAVSCFVSTKPTSLITDPSIGATIEASKNYIIKGTSFDVGGSSVKQVEISIDGGDSWQKVTPKESVSTGFNWEYVWSKPAAGLYLIKTRATDWLDNIETDNAGMSVQVASSGGPSSVEEVATSTVTTTSLDEKIIAIQQQIIQLILQLIALIKSGA
jgi:hypothetical protein